MAVHGGETKSHHTGRFVVPLSDYGGKYHHIGRNWALQRAQKPQPISPMADI